MTRARIKWKPNGLYQLRTGPKALSEVDSRGKRVKRSAEASGGKYKVVTTVGDKNPQGRARTSVTTADFKARRINAKRFTLLKALDSGR